MIPVLCKSMIVGTMGRKKINKVVISKEVYSSYAKPMKDKMLREQDPHKFSILKKMYKELFGDYVVEGSPLYLKLTNEKEDNGEIIKCSLIELPHYLERI